MLLLEYSVLTVSVVISVLLYGFTATLGALITRLTLNGALLENRKNPQTEPCTDGTANLQHREPVVPSYR